MPVDSAPPAPLHLSLVVADTLLHGANSFGVEGSGLHLDLVYNPLGAFLPPDQASLEAKYREELEQAFGAHSTQPTHRGHGYLQVGTG